MWAPRERNEGVLGEGRVPVSEGLFPSRAGPEVRTGDTGQFHRANTRLGGRAVNVGPALQ